MMKLTKRKLKSLNPCSDGYEFYLKCDTTDLKQFTDRLIKIDRFDWADWLLPRLMTHNQTVQYAVFAARQVLHIFEKAYPDDNRPRLAIEAAEKCLKRNTAKNRAARAAAGAVVDAAWAAGAAGAAARAAGAAGSAVDAAGNVAARKKMQIKIIKNGLKILNNQGKGE